MAAKLPEERQEQPGEKEAEIIFREKQYSRRAGYIPDESQPGLQKININDELNVTIDDDTERERVKSEIRAEYAEPLAGLVKAGEMSQARADYWMHERVRKLVMTAIDRDPVVTKEILYGEGIDTILTKADEELLELEDMEYLRNRAAAAERHRQLKHKDEQEKELMAAEEMAWDISRTGDVLGLEDLLDTLNIPTADKKRLLGDAHRTAKLLAEDKPNPYTTISKPDVYWKNYTKVLRDSDSMTEREITAMVPDVCGINQAKEILNLKKKPEDDPLKSPQAAMYLKRLESLYIKSGKLTGYIKTTAEWDKLNRILIRHIEENPKETAEELGKFFEALVKPYKEKKITKFLKAVGKIYDYRMLARGDYGFKLAGALGWTEGEGEGKEEEVAITKTATNPKTGKKIGWNGTKWIPIP